MNNHHPRLFLPEDAAQAAQANKLSEMMGAPTKTIVIPMPVCDCASPLEMSNALGGLFWCPNCKHKVDVVGRNGERWFANVVINSFNAARQIMQAKINQIFFGDGP